MLSSLEYMSIIVFLWVWMFTCLSVYSIFFINSNSNVFFSIIIFLCASVNWIIFIVLDLYIVLVLFIPLSFLSLLIVWSGFGVSWDTCILFFFKLLGDVFLGVFIGSYLFMEGLLTFSCFWGSFSFCYDFLIIFFLVYSLCGINGFWIYWAMDASYFISSYLHTWGFIFICIALFFKFFMLDSFSFIMSNEVYFMFVSAFIFSYIIFIVFFSFEKNYKNSLGYYSCSSISMSIVWFLISPSYGLGSFIVSVLYKIYAFEVMEWFSSLSNKVNMKYSDLVFNLVYGGFIIIGSVLGCSFHFINFSYWSFFEIRVLKSSFFIWWLGILKLLGLFIFNLSVYIMGFIFDIGFVIVGNSLLFIIVFFLSICWGLNGLWWYTGGMVFIMCFLVIFYYYGSFNKLSVLYMEFYMKLWGMSFFYLVYLEKLISSYSNYWFSSYFLSFKNEWFNFSILDPICIGCILIVSFLTLIF